MSEAQTIDSELDTYRKRRKALMKKVAEVSSEAVAHIENGSFEAVEQALTECQDGICELKEVIKKDKKKRRTRKNDTTAQSSAG